MARDYGDNPFDLRRYASIASPQQQSPLPKAYRNISFDNPQLRGQTAEPVSSDAREVEDPFMSAINRMRGGKATEAYRSHLSDLPNQSNYQPSKWRRLGAALTAGAASFGKDPQNALALGEQVRDARYRGALENWQLKGAGLKEQAGIEAVDQTAQLARMKQMLDYKNTQADNERLDRAQRATERYQQDTIEARKAQGWKDYNDENGHLIIYNPTTGEKQDMGPSAKTTELGNAAQGMRYRERELGQGDRRIGLEGQRVGLEGERVRQGERGLGLEERRTAATEKNATTSAANAENRNYVAPGTGDAAEASAARTIVAKHPEFGQYLDDKGLIKLPADYAVPWYKRGDGKPPDPATDDNYRAFLGMVEAEKNRVLNTRRPGSPTLPPPDGTISAPMRFNFNELPR